MAEQSLGSIGPQVAPQIAYKGNDENSSSGGGIGSVVLPLAAGGAGLAGGYFYGEAPKVDQFINSNKIEVSGNVTDPQKAALETMNGELERTSAAANAEADKIFVDKDGKPVTELTAEQFLGASEADFKAGLEARRAETPKLQQTAKDAEKALQDAKAAEQAAQAQLISAQQAVQDGRAPHQQRFSDVPLTEAEQAKIQEAETALQRAKEATATAQTAYDTANQALEAHVNGIREGETRLGQLKDGRITRESFVSKMLQDLRAGFTKEDSVFAKAFGAVKGLFSRVHSWKVGGIVGGSVLALCLLASHFLSGGSQQTQQTQQA